jgi:prevent-host-death family protein
MVQVSVRELKDHLAAYLRRANSGEEVVVTSRGKPVATLRSPDPAPLTSEEKWRDLERRGIVRLGKGKYVPPERLIPLQGEGPTVTEIILADRD